MLLEITLLLIGLVMLVFAADKFIEGSAALATSLKIPQLVVGLTVVAFGTSAPELVVAINATVKGSGQLAIGNVVGSNIANILLILGASALFSKIQCAPIGAKANCLFMLLATLVFCIVAYWGGEIRWLISIIFLLILGAYLFAVLKFEFLTGDIREQLVTDLSMKKIVFFIFVGATGLILGSELLVQNSVILARHFGLREEVIGLSVIAIGTSLPELATAISAAKTKNYELLMGNILGSNIFNILAVGSAIGLSGGAKFSEKSLSLDVAVMALSAFIITALIFSKAKVSSKSSALLLLLFSGYLVLLGSTSMA